MQDNLRGLRQQLIDRRDDDRPPRNFYSLIATSKPATAIVPLVEGSGRDPAALAQALRVLKRRVADAGVAYAGKRRAFAKPSERRRFKTVMARRRARRSAQRALRAEMRREAMRER